MRDEGRARRDRSADPVRGDRRAPDDGNDEEGQQIMGQNLTSWAVALFTLGACLPGCAIPAVRCPGALLTASQIQNIRVAQQAMREGRAATFPASARTEAEYFAMCGKLDPVTRERVLP